MKTTVNSTKKENSKIKRKKKVVKVYMNNTEVFSIQFQLDSSSDVTLINEQTWKKICKLTL